jgi:hypothetical protein
MLFNAGKECNATLSLLACTRGIRLNARMRGGAVLVLLGITALGAYSVGRHAPASNAPVAAASVQSPLAGKPVAFVARAQPPAAVPTSTASSDLTATIKASQPERAAPIAPHAKPAPPDAKRKVEGALTAAAIAAIIVQASRAQYHAGGRPCACPDDTMRNGRACGGRSAYSRPGGAAPLCYPHDVTAGMIESYRQRQASR